MRKIHSLLSVCKLYRCGDTMKEIMIITGASSGMGKEFA